MEKVRKEENSIEKQINSNILNFITFKEIESYENSLKINLLVQYVMVMVIK